MMDQPQASLVRTKRPMGSGGGDIPGQTSMGDILRGVFKAWIGAGLGGGAGGQVAGAAGGGENQQFDQPRAGGLTLQQQPIFKMNDPMNPWNQGY